MTLKMTKYEKMTETSPYSATDDSTPFVVYRGTKRKLNIRGNTVARPYMNVCLNNDLNALNR